MAQRRILKEHRDLCALHADWLSVEFATEKNGEADVFQWICWIAPTGGMYEGLRFEVHVKLPRDYPFKVSTQQAHIAEGDHHARTYLDDEPFRRSWGVRGCPSLVASCVVRCTAYFSMWQPPSASYQSDIPHPAWRQNEPLGCCGNGEWSPAKTVVSWLLRPALLLFDCPISKQLIKEGNFGMSAQEALQSFIVEEWVRRAHEFEPADAGMLRANTAAATNLDQPHAASTDERPHSPRCAAA